MKIIVTGAAGFIGSALVRSLTETSDIEVIGIDKMTYSGNLTSLGNSISSKKFKLYEEDICNEKKIREIFEIEKPEKIIHLAAESHVDRSIDMPDIFFQTNTIGTHVLAKTSLDFWKSLDHQRGEEFLFIHVSTDEVYGSLGKTEHPFTEESPYKPNSPYSASKAASDHIIRAYTKTFKLPSVTVNCSNNFGPYQLPEKLVPSTIIKALRNLPITIYGNGNQIRDWIFVNDHVRALTTILQSTNYEGEKFNVGGENELSNIEIVHFICDYLQEIVPNDKYYRELITHVNDRPGHDSRYAINCAKFKSTFAWHPNDDIFTELKKTTLWYVENSAWWEEAIKDGNLLKRQGIYN